METCQLHLPTQGIGHNIGLPKFVLPNYVELNKKVFPSSSLWQQVPLSLEVAHINIVRPKNELGPQQLVPLCVQAMHYDRQFLLISKVYLVYLIDFPTFENNRV